MIYGPIVLPFIQFFPASSIFFLFYTDHKLPCNETSSSIFIFAYTVIPLCRQRSANHFTGSPGGYEPRPRTYDPVPLEERRRKDPGYCRTGSAAHPAPAKALPAAG